MQSHGRQMALCLCAEAFLLRIIPSQVGRPLCELRRPASPKSRPNRAVPTISQKHRPGPAGWVVHGRSRLTTDIMQSPSLAQVRANVSFRRQRSA